MAQLFEKYGFYSMSKGEYLVKNFIHKELPDYIYAGFCISPKTEGINDIETDVLLLVPHLGVFLLEIKNSKISCADGKIYATSVNGDLRELKTSWMLSEKYAYVRYFQERFNVTPFIYSALCLVNEDSELDNLPPELENHVLLKKDFKDSASFMKKLYEIVIFNITNAYLGGVQFSKKFDDIDDNMAALIFDKWEEGGFRRNRPPKDKMLFLSYSKENKMMANAVQKYIEEHGIFVWAFPNDIPIGGDYRSFEIEALNESDGVILLLSPASQESLEVEFEIDYAISHHKTLFPLLINDVEVNDNFQQKLKFNEWREMRKFDFSIMDEIIAELNKLTE